MMRASGVHAPCTSMVPSAVTSRLPIASSSPIFPRQTKEIAHGKSPESVDPVTRHERNGARPARPNQCGPYASRHRRRVLRSSRAAAARPHARPVARVGGSARARGRRRRRLREVRDPRSLAGNSGVARRCRARDVGPDSGDRSLYRAKQSAACSTTCSNCSHAIPRRSPPWAHRSRRSPCIRSPFAAIRGMSAIRNRRPPRQSASPRASAKTETRRSRRPREASPPLPLGCNGRI